MDGILKQIYEANLGPGALHLWRLSKAQNHPFSQEAVRKWLGKQEQHQEYAKNGMDKPRNWFKITDKPNSFAVDAIIKGDYNKNKFGNKGFRGFLLFIELTTRKAYAYPFKTGSVYSAPTATEALALFKQFEAQRKGEGHPVAKMSGDNGKEFDNTQVLNFLHSKFITTYFHRPEDHRANGILNAAARYIQRKIGDTDWLTNLDAAIDIWNAHENASVNNQKPDDLENDVVKRQDIREEALEHNREVWERTHKNDDDIVLRYLRRNTKDKNIFQKEGRNFTGDYQIKERRGWSHVLFGPDKKEKGAFRPYELRNTHKLQFDKEKTDYQKKQEVVRQNRKERAEEMARVRELGAERAVPIERAARARAAPVKAVVAKQQLKPAEEKPADVVDIPLKILDHDWGTGKKRENLRFLIQWKNTPEFRKKWEGRKELFQTWGKIISSWQPWSALTQRGVTNAVVEDYLKTQQDKTVIADIRKKMGI